MNDEEREEAPTLEERVATLEGRLEEVENTESEGVSYYAYENLANRVGRLENRLYEYATESDLDYVRGHVEDLLRRMDKLERDRAFGR